jgi:hypothetical protein
MRARSILGVSGYALLTAIMLSACSSKEAPNQAPAIHADEAPSETVIASFEVEFDPRAPGAMKFTPVAVRAGSVLPSGADLGSAHQALTAGSAKLEGAGVWDAANSTMWADVTITQTGTDTQNWDEPYLVVTGIVATPTTASVTTTVKNAGTLRDSSGVSITSGGAGSKYGFADIPATGHNHAKQTIGFKNPTGAPFKFYVDLTATRTVDAVVADSDDDFWNVEPFSQPAGGDCNDTTASAPALTCTTPPTGSGCDIACPTSTSPTCPTAGTTDNCCVATDSSSSASNLCPTTSGVTCSCDQTYKSSNGTVSFDCQASTDCNVRVDGPKVANVACGSGTNCNLVCTKQGTTDCNITSCTSASCSITLDAGGSSAASMHGDIQSCTGTSSCAVTCASQADCSLACGSTTATCAMYKCDIAKTCVLTCTSPQVAITCSDTGPNKGKKMCAASGSTC